MTPLTDSLKSLAPRRPEAEPATQPIDVRRIAQLRDDCLKTARDCNAILSEAGVILNDDLPVLSAEKGELREDGRVMGARFIVPDGGGSIRYVRMADYSRKLILELAPDLQVERR